MLFTRMSAGHESLHFFSDEESGLQAIVAIHSTRLGPALGGTRFFPYKSENEALSDVLRLAQAMSFKAAAAGVALGGGKAVILGDPVTQKSPELLAAYGRAVDRLGGGYITAEDVGTTVDDMVEIRKETTYVTGLPLHLGGSGDPSPATAAGVMAAIQATAETLWSRPDLDGMRVAVQGVGKVGSVLVDHLVRHGCEVFVGDVDPDAAASVSARHPVNVVSASSVLFRECEIVAPCAMGGILNEGTIPRLRCRAIVGSANNQLSEPRDAERLASVGITYVPDFIVNAGGLINISVELEGYSEKEAAARVRNLAVTTKDTLETAMSSGDLPVTVAQRRAVDRLSDRERTGST